MPRLTFPLIAYPLIGIFWLTMWTLLLRSELRPDQTTLRAVPLEHVEQLLFRDDQATELMIKNGGAGMGTLRIVPHEAAGQNKELLFSGNLLIQAAQGERQRLSWNGELAIGAKFDMELLHLRFALHELRGPQTGQPPIDITIDPKRGRARYAWQSDLGIEDQQEFSLDQAGLKQLMNYLGVDASLLPGGMMPDVGAPVVTARQSTLELPHGGAITVLDTYLVSVVLNGQTLLEAQVSQFGKILRVKTILDWTLESD